MFGFGSDFFSIEYKPSLVAQRKNIINSYYSLTRSLY